VTPLIIRRTLPASQQRVFNAWTRPEVMCRWFYPDPRWSAKVVADVRVGGTYRLEMRDDEGRIHVQHGEYQVIQPVSRLVFTWTCEEVGVVGSVVTLDLTGRGDETELTLRHDLPDVPGIRERHEAGWVGCIGQLQRLMEE
jgi:uncharacterized protein YndB with AHSA1/START domain